MPDFGRAARRSRFTLFISAAVLCLLLAEAAQGADRARSVDPASVTVYPVAHQRGLMVTTGGWAYCLQVEALARQSGYTLLCGRYFKDGYTGFGLRSRRHLDWGNPAYLASFAAKIAALHRRVGGQLVMIGVSYSGFGVATLASHHPELRPARLIVIDSFLDLVARRSALPSTHDTAREIDSELTDSGGTLPQRTVSVSGLAQLVRAGTNLTIIWSVSPGEKREFSGATCDAAANATTLAELANTLDAPVTGWVTHSKHGYDLWNNGRTVLAGKPPGRQVLFKPGSPIPPTAICG